MGHGHTDKQKLKQALCLAISDLKEADVDLTRGLARIDRRLDKGAGIGWACTQIAHLISNYLITHEYQAPASVIELQQFAERTAQVYRGKFNPLMWFL